MVELRYFIKGYSEDEYRHPKSKHAETHQTRYHFPWCHYYSGEKNRKKEKKRIQETRNIVNQFNFKSKRMAHTN